jgi:hypothetical protein
MRDETSRHQDIPAAAIPGVVKRKTYLVSVK